MSTEPRDNKANMAVRTYFGIVREHLRVRHQAMANSDGAARILIADDHEMIRRGLRHVIERHERWRVCGEAANGHEAVGMARKFLPHVVILDLIMPELNGVETTRRIKKYLPQTEVLIFSGVEPEEPMRQVLEAGARGYLVKSDLGRHIVDAIEALLQHRTFFSPRVAEIMLDASLSGDPQPTDDTNSTDKLTAREREVIQRVAEGYSNKESAARLDMSVKTLQTHRTAINRKLDIHSTAQAVRYAIRNRITAA